MTLKEKVELVYKQLKDEFYEIILGPSILILIVLIITIISNKNLAINDVTSALISSSLFVIITICMINYLLPITYIIKTKKSNIYAVKMLEYGMGFIRTLISFCLYIIIFFAFNLKHPDFNIIIFYMLTFVMSFLLFINIMTKFIIAKYRIN